MKFWKCGNVKISKSNIQLGIGCWVLAVFTIAHSGSANAEPVKTASQPWVTNQIAQVEESLESRLALASQDATNYTDAAVAALAAETNSYLKAESDPTVPAWAKKSAFGAYNDDLYRWIAGDFHGRGAAIRTQYDICTTGATSKVLVGAASSYGAFPHAELAKDRLHIYGEDIDHAAQYRHDRIRLWPWWNEDADDYIEYMLPTNGPGMFALREDIPSMPTEWDYTAITNAPWLTSYTETDPTVPAWAKASSKPGYSYSEISGTPTTWPYTAITNAPWLTSETDPTVPSAASAATNYTDAVAARYLPLSGGVVTGSVFVAQQPGDTNAILAAVGEQTYGRYSVPASGSYPGLSIDYKDERTIAALLKEDDMPLVRLERIKHGRYSTYSSYVTNDLQTIEYEKAELDMDGLGHVRIDKDGNSVACDIRWPEPPEGTNYVCGTMALREEIPEVPTEWDYSAITNAPWLTSYTETDPTVPGWAKASSKPSYSYSEISNTPDLSGYATTAALDAGTNTVAGLGARIFYGTCSTGASTAAKVVTCAGFKTADLKAGTVLWVKFANAQTYNGAPTINVNSTGAVNIKRVGTSNAARYEWVAGELICFVHDGSYWVMTDGGLATTSYYGATKLTTTATSTGTALALTPASLNSFSQGMVAPYPVYSKAAIYEPGDRVRYAYNSYICKASVISQDWSEASWQMIDPVQTQIDDLKPSGPIATNSVVRATSGDACRVSLASGATLSAALDVEGVPVMGIVEPAGAYSVSPSIHLLGYGTWPTNSFQAVFWKVGQTTFANVLSEL